VAFAAGFARRKNHTPHDEATGNGQNEQETERPVANSRILGAQLSQWYRTDAPAEKDAGA